MSRLCPATALLTSDSHLLVVDERVDRGGAVAKRGDRHAHAVVARGRVLDVGQDDTPLRRVVLLPDGICDSKGVYMTSCSQTIFLWMVN